MEGNHAGVAVGARQARSFLPRTVLLHLTLFSIMVVTTGILSEIALRASGLVATKRIRTAVDATFNTIPGMFEPGQDLIERPRAELAYHVTTNSLGYRGRELLLSKSPDTLRVLCLGDSFTFGSFVDDEETLPYLLQEEFRQAERRAEVINAGVGGTTIVDQTFFLKRSLALNPQLVILTFTENDLDDLARAEPLYKSFERNRKLKSQSALRPIYEMVHDTALFGFALLIKNGYFQDVVPEGPATGSGTVDRNTRWNQYQRALQNMRDLLRERSIPFVFVMFPSHYRIAPTSSDDRFLEGIEQMARGLGIATVNLLQPLRRSGLKSNELYLLPYDGHPGRTAYAIAARTIYQFLSVSVLKAPERAA